MHSASIEIKVLKVRTSIALLCEQTEKVLKTKLIVANILIMVEYYSESNASDLIAETV